MEEQRQNHNSYAGVQSSVASAGQYLKNTLQTMNEIFVPPPQKKYNRIESQDLGHQKFNQHYLFHLNLNQRRDLSNNFSSLPNLNMKNNAPALGSPSPPVRDKADDHAYQKRNGHQHHYLKEIINTATHPEQSSKEFHIARSPDLATRFPSDISYLSNRLEKLSNSYQN